MGGSDLMKEHIMNNIDGTTPGRIAIAALNDRLRVHGRGGRILQTQGIQVLDEEQRRKTFEAIRRFAAFTPDNDPHGEHDFGEITVDGISVMFKIDYYDPAGRYHSSDPADPALTLRVMTVMLSDEY